MNKDFVLFNLREAAKALQKIIKNIDSQPDYDPGEYIVEMTHLYHHVNTAWNAQNVDQEDAEKCSEEDFFKWRQFPKDDIHLSK
ncbi:MAG: hypothetical protein ACYSYL_12670 [Planctomycetota bacterium]|jgi:hypothetical protein